MIYLCGYLRASLAEKVRNSECSQCASFLQRAVAFWLKRRWSGGQCPALNSGHRDSNIYFPLNGLDSSELLRTLCSNNLYFFFKFISLYFFVLLFPARPDTKRSMHCTGFDPMRIFHVLQSVLHTVVFWARGIPYKLT